MNKSTEQTKWNVKHGPLFVSQSKDRKRKTETKNGTSGTKTETRTSQSLSNRLFENEYSVIKTQQSERNTTGQSKISTPNSSRLPKTDSKIVRIQKLSVISPDITEMDRDIFYHWGPTHEIMENICGRSNSPRTGRIVEQRKALSLQKTLRRRYDPQTQRTVFAPSPAKINTAEKKL